MKRTHPIRPITAKQSVMDSKLVLFRLSYQNLSCVWLWTTLSLTRWPGLPQQPSQSGCRAPILHRRLNPLNFPLQEWCHHPSTWPPNTGPGVMLSLIPTPNQPLSPIEWEDFLNLTWVFRMTPTLPRFKTLSAPPPFVTWTTATPSN